MSNGDVTGSMLGILPPLMIAGGTLLIMERFMGEPQKRKKQKPFDRLERRDSREKGRGLDFGNFGNLP